MKCIVGLKEIILKSRYVKRSKDRVKKINIQFEP